MTNQGISYISRDFTDVRQSLIDYVNQYYPEYIDDFSDATIGSILIDLCAGVADNLAYHTDRMFQETQLFNAQKRKSILDIARTLGFKVPNKMPSVALCEFSVTVPVLGDTYDESYAPVLRAGTQVIGGGKIFELTTDLDFNSRFSAFGTPNFKLIPNLLDNGTVGSYTITKQELVFNGLTKTVAIPLSNEFSVPFKEVLLPDVNVLSISSVIVKTDGTPLQDSDFNNENLKWYEVDSLAENKVFVPSHNISNIDANNRIVYGDWKSVSSKFIKEFTDRGFCKLIFGGGSASLVNVDNNLFSGAEKRFVTTYVQNNTTGDILPNNGVLYIRYRVGGGSDSNTGRGTINSFGNINYVSNGQLADIRNIVRRSLGVINITPAIGGRDALNIEELRHLIAYNFSSQNRCVTIKDYIARVYQMDSIYGVPFKFNAYKENNKIIISILNLNPDGTLSNVSNNLMKRNIANYLSHYKMLNDYIEVRDGKVINLGYDIEVYADDVASNNQIVVGITNAVRDFHDINKRKMNEDIFLAPLFEKIRKVPGVINILDVKVFNKYGGIYSLNEVTQPYINQSTRQIALINNTIYSDKDVMFEVKDILSDVRVTIKRSADLASQSFAFPTAKFKTNLINFNRSVGNALVYVPISFNKATTGKEVLRLFVESTNDTRVIVNLTNNGILKIEEGVKEIQVPIVVSYNIGNLRTGSYPVTISLRMEDIDAVNITQDTATFTNKVEIKGEYVYIDNNTLNNLQMLLLRRRN